MIAYTRAQIERLLKIDFIRFSIVGGTGFVINLILLTLLHKVIGVPTFFAQLVAAEIALFSNFILHHNWTYKEHKVKKSVTNLLIQFHATSWPAIIGSAVMVSAGEKYLHLGALTALVITSAITLMWNFVWSKFVIWRNVTPAEVEESVA